MATAISSGLPFEAAAARGVPDTPETRTAFAQLRTQIEQMKARGLAIELPFD